MFFLLLRRSRWGVIAARWGGRERGRQLNMAHTKQSMYVQWRSSAGSSQTADRPDGKVTILLCCGRHLSSSISAVEVLKTIAQREPQIWKSFKVVRYPICLLRSENCNLMHQWPVKSCVQWKWFLAWIVGSRFGIQQGVKLWNQDWIRWTLCWDGFRGLVECKTNSCAMKDVLAEQYIIEAKRFSTKLIVYIFLFICRLSKSLWKRLTARKESTGMVGRSRKGVNRSRVEVAQKSLRP